MSEQAIAQQPHQEVGVESDDVDSISIAVWGFVSVLIVVIVMFASAAMYNVVQSGLNTERLIGSNYAETDRAYSTQLGNLNEWAAPKTEGGFYQIPIAEAKALVLKEQIEAQKSE